MRWGALLLFIITLSITKLSVYSNYYFESDNFTNDKEESPSKTNNQLKISQEKIENPSFLLLNQFVSGNGEDSINDFEWDSDGNTVLVGLTTSTNLPMKDSVFPNKSEDWDVFVMKFSKENELLWSTYLGGNASDHQPYPDYRLGSGFAYPWNKQVAVTVDINNDVIVVGSTYSSDFPIVSGFEHPTEEYELLDGYIAKFSSNGSLLWSTYFGSMYNDMIEDVTSDTNGSIYVTGCVDFGEPYYGDKQGDIFIAKFLANGTHEWTYRDNDPLYYEQGIEITHDHQGNIIAVGQTACARGSFWCPYDIIILKLNSAGDQIFSRTYGGVGFDRGFTLDININNQILISGIASSDFNTEDDQFSNQEGYVILFPPDGGDPIWIQQYPEIESEFESVSFDYQGNVIVAGEVNFNDSTLSRIPFENNYIQADPSYLTEYGGTMVAKLSITDGNVIWWTLLSYNEAGSEAYYNDISHIDFGPDNNIYVAGKMLGNENSFNFPLSSNFNIDITGNASGFLTILPDPLTDYDGDFLSNLYECRNGLNLTNWRDAFQDQDSDTLTTVQESLIGTDPWMNDTDNDQMDDGWEYDNELDPLSNNSQDDPDKDLIPNFGEYILDLDPHQADGFDDSDSDGIPNYWEYLYGLDISDTTDGKNDFDSDDLSNLEEFKLGTNPLLADTDGDGESDAYEVDHGTDPLDPTSNYRRRLLIIGLIGGLIFITIFAVYVLNRRSKSKGFINIVESYKTRRSGFETKSEKDLAENRGFKNKQILQIVQGTGYNSMDAMIKEWTNFINRLDETNFQAKIQNIEELISVSGTPDDLITSIQQSNEIFNDIVDSKNKIISFKSTADILKNFRKGDIGKYTNNLTQIELLDMTAKLNSSNDHLSSYENKIKNIISEKQSWFEPWDRLLSLIQMTQDGTPIHTSEISKVINLDTVHTEELLDLLLKENELIGTYEKESKIYTKGTLIEKYLNSILSRTHEFLISFGE
ncbi:MAG: hypothetical protein ACW99A_17405 [Candidatus Kariarchaeaceae archaeon]|jgi:hypothetical protein